MAESPRQDRLSAIISRFELRVLPSDPAAANLLMFACCDTGLPSRLVFSTVCKAPADTGTTSISDDNSCHTTAAESETGSFAATVFWGGKSNPLLAALPGTINLAI
ncbi:MAG: hypothetical protein AAF404_22020, partial [Pseudomonadota bacterium]